MAYRTGGPFNTWVSPKLGLLGIFIILLPLLTVNGVYTFNIADLVGSLGNMTEDITYASYASAAGMVAVLPILIRIKSYLKGRNILFMSLISVGILSVICANTTSLFVLTIGNFLLGALKFIGILELTLPLMFILSPKGERFQFYSVYYPLSIIAGQASGWVTAWLAYRYNWQYVYYFSIPFILLAIATVLILYHNERSSRKVPLYQIDWLGMFLFSAILLIINYVGVYGKYEDWLDSVYIQAALISLPILIFWFIKRQLRRKRPYVELKVFRIQNVYIAFILMMFMMLLYSTGNIQSAFTTSIMKLDVVHNSSINLWMIPGVIIGAVFCFIWFRLKRGVRGAIFIGFVALILYHFIVYFYFYPGTGEQDLYIPLMLKGFGLLILYIAIALLAVEKLSINDMLASLFFLLIARSAAGPTLATSLYTNMLYQKQVQNVTELANNMDALNPYVQARYQTTYQGALAQGKSVEAARNLASQNLQGIVQLQSLMISGRQIFGWVTMTGGVVLILVLIVPMNAPGVKKKRKFAKWRKYRKAIRKNKLELSEV